MNAWSFTRLNSSIADKKSALSARTQLWLLTFAHAVVDTYALTLSHLLPLLLRKFAIPMASWDRLTGIIIAVSAAFNSLNQVTFGLLSDRIRTIHILTFGITVTAVCTSLLGIVPTFFLTPCVACNRWLGGCGIPSASGCSSRLTRQTGQRIRGLALYYGRQRWAGNWPLLHHATAQSFIP